MEHSESHGSDHRSSYRQRPRRPPPEGIGWSPTRSSCGKIQSIVSVNRSQKIRFGGRRHGGESPVGRSDDPRSQADGGAEERAESARRMRPRPNAWFAFLIDSVADDQEARGDLPDLNPDEILAWADAYHADAPMAKLERGADSGSARRDVVDRGGRT